MKTIKLIALFFVGAAVFTSCSSDDDNPTPVNEEEVITTMTLTLTPAAGAVVTLQTQDLDGDGPNAPVINISGPLAANTTYTGSIELLNETETPAEDITAEVQEEDDEHQFFFSTTGSVTGTAYTDQDGNGNPIGLAFTLTTGAAGAGTVMVTLRHQPNKTAAGVSEGDITNAGGETDITETFTVTVN